MIIEKSHQINKILEKLSKKRVAIVTHENPDGDGLATAIAFCFCLRELYEAQPMIIMDSPFPSFLEFLIHRKVRIFSYKQYIAKFRKNIDYLIVLDCHEKKRVDCDIKIFDIINKALVIDHHVTKKNDLIPSSDYYLDSHAACTGVMIHRFMNKKIKEYIKRFP